MNKPVFCTEDIITVNKASDWFYYWFFWILGIKINWFAMLNYDRLT
jgi:hypothetical protein